jgi:amidase
MGEVGGLPVGLSLFAEAWSEAKLLSFAYAYEQRTHARTPPRYLATISGEGPLAAALRPAEHPAAQ